MKCRDHVGAGLMSQWAVEGGHDTIDPLRVLDLVVGWSLDVKWAKMMI